MPLFAWEPLKIPGFKVEIKRRSKESWEGGKIPPPSPNLCFPKFFSFLRIWRKKSAKKIGKAAGDKELCRWEEPPEIQGPSKGISVIPAPLPMDFLELCCLEMSPELPRVDFPGKVTLVLHQKVPFAFYSGKKKWKSWVVPTGKRNCWCFITIIWEFSPFGAEFSRLSSCLHLSNWTKSLWILKVLGMNSGKVPIPGKLLQAFFVFA